jgi:GntR family transcriptional regulator/MocR family aminotransferase
VRFDFRVEAGDLAAFPRRLWLQATRRALAAAPDAALGYGDRGGVPALREALAAHLGRSRGVVADAAGVVVTNGVTQAVGMLGSVLRRRGVRRVAVEDPGFFVHQGLLRRLGLQVVGVPVDEDGLRVDLLGRGIGAVLVTPAHQFPTGAALAPDRRTALLAWAQEHDALVIEDDYDAEFRYDRAPVGALQGLAPGHVALVGSVSKTLAPAVRLGWVVPPADLLADVVAEKAWADGGCPALPQLVLAELVTGGDLDRHLRRQRPLLRRRRDALLAALAVELPEARVGGVAAGLHVLAVLPDVADPAGFFAAQWAGGVAVHGDAADGGVRVLLGWANCPEAAIAPGVCAFARIARRFLGAAAQPSRA